MHYHLSGLGTYEFENMVQALAVCVLGDGVSVFGAGPDGGREATFDGPVAYPDPSPEGENDNPIWPHRAGAERQL